MPRIVQTVPETAEPYQAERRVKSDMGKLIEQWWNSGAPAIAWTPEEINQVGGEGKSWNIRLNILRGSIFRSLHRYPTKGSPGVLLDLFEGRMPEIKYDDTSRTMYLTRPE